MRIVVIGGVAAGMAAAAKARRCDEKAEIVVFDRDEFVSYSTCAMPYYFSGTVQDAQNLVPRDEKFFKAWSNIDIYTMTEVRDVDSKAKTLTVHDIRTGTTRVEPYDRLIMAMGARANIPSIKGVDLPHVFKLKNIGDMTSIQEYIMRHKVKNAVVIGTGLIGLETGENLSLAGIKVSFVERLPQVAPMLDADMAEYIESHILSKGLTIYKSAQVDEITADKVKLGDGTEIEAELVFVAAGARPETELAVKAGVELGVTGAIKVNSRLETNIKDIYAGGDCAEHHHILTGEAAYVPLGSTANKMGRVIGENITGGNAEFEGILGTSILQIFDMAAARTGLNLSEAAAAGYDDVDVALSFKPDRLSVMGGTDMLIKSFADKKTGKILGAQIVGARGVDKRIDVFATAITFGAKAKDLYNLDLAYAPPFSSARDPVAYHGMIHDNAINHKRLTLTPQQLQAKLETGEKLQLIDVRSAGQFNAANIADAINLPLTTLRQTSEQLDKDIPVVVYCNSGVTSHTAQNILINQGFKKVYNMTGGIRHYPARKK